MTDGSQSNTASPQQPLPPSSAAGRNELRANWIWFLGIGILLDVLGIVAVGSAYVVSMQSLGWLLIVCGLIRGSLSLIRNRSSATFIEILTALLYAMVGALLVTRPGTENTVVTYSLVIAVLFILDGILHIAGSMIARYPNWQWLMVDGILVLMVGVGLALWRQFSHVRMSALAWLLGITMLLNGGALLVLAWTGKKLPKESR